MKTYLLRGIQLLSCFIIGGAAVVWSASPAQASPPNPCPNIACTLDLQNMSVYCGYASGQICSMSGPTTCNPGGACG
jgi:hypothetical protein